MSKNRYPKSLKLEAIKRGLQRESVAKLALELGVNSNSLYNWVSQYRGEVLLTLQELSPEQGLTELRKENARLKEEREILKKAATYFAKHQR